MTDDEKTKLYQECWKVINRVNALIAGIEHNQRTGAPVDKQAAINALINVTNQVISLGKAFGVSV